MPSSIFSLISLSITGIFGGVVGYAVLGILAAGIVLAIVMAIVSSVKGKKEENDDDPLAEISTYEGEDGFVLPKDEDNASTDWDYQSIDNYDAQFDEVASDEQNITPEQSAPVANEAPAYQQPVQEPVKEEPAVAEQPAPLPKVSEENPIAGDTVPVEQRQGDWSNYDGEYDGYYYDPIDVCYYEGKPPVYVQKMYLPPQETIVRKIKSPAAPLTEKPREERQPIKKSTSGLDIAIIYGQYVIEHNNAGEYFFTLYDNKDNMLFESYNYSSEQFCKDAVKRFKKHVLAGAFSVVSEGGKYHFELVRKINTYLGPEKATREDAEDSIKNVKYFAQTDVERVQ